MEPIRNFVIIAHIDHGKSTLADRMLDLTGTIEKRKMKAQFLDQMELEQERGITIKMAPVRMSYKNHILNLIDTPGHSDFSYEVSRALNAVEGAILLVDATQGIQAQTLANYHSAKSAGLKIIGVLNKIDLNPDHIDDIAEKTAKLIGVKKEDILRVSGKTGQGVEELLDAIIEQISPPLKPETNELRALIFDSVYNDHKGDIAYVRIMSGTVKDTDDIHLLATSTNAKAKEVGIFAPELKPNKSLSAGDIGYIATGIKDTEKIKIGDTVASHKNTKALPGYKDPSPVVFVSFYPNEASDYDELLRSLQKLHLSDSSLFYEPDRSEVLGRGFKCGFLGRLHYEIIAERIQREFDIEIINSFPSVEYKIKKNNEEIIIQNPKDFPDDYDVSWQPMVQVEIITSTDYLSNIMAIARSFHIDDIRTENLDDQIILTAKMPLADLIRDFDDQIKSASAGFASFSYKLLGFEEGKIDKLEILVAGVSVSGLTRIVARDELEREGRKMVEKLKDLLPKQQFTQAIQAKSRGNIIARETIPAMRKDVTGHLYGGDRTRKMKLWKKQQKGKKKLKERAEVHIDPSIFRELLKK